MPYVRRRRSAGAMRSCRWRSARALGVLGDGAAARASAFGGARGRTPVAAAAAPAHPAYGVARAMGRSIRIGSTRLPGGLEHWSSTNFAWGGDNGLPPRRTPARSLQLQRAVPVLDRRGSRQRHLRHDRRVAFRQGDDRRRRRRRPDDRDDRARAGQHPGGQLAGRGVPGRRRSRPQQEEAILGVYTGKRGGPVARAREARRRGRLGGEGADHVRRAGRARARSSSATLATPSSSRTRTRPAPRRRCTDTVFSTVPARRCSSASRRTIGRKTTSSASTSISRATTRCKARSCSTA